MEIMLQNLETEEMFNKILGKVDYLIKVQIVIALIVMDFCRKMGL